MSTQLRMKFWMTAGLVLGLALVLRGGATAAGPNLVTNGGFESATVAPWTVLSGDVDIVSGWQPSEGTKSLDLNGFFTGSISQSFPTVPGQAYELLFDLAGNPGNGGIVTVRVDVAGQTAIYTFDTAGRTTTAMGWVGKSLNFTATGSSTTLNFTSLTTDPLCLSGTYAACGPALDNIRVFQLNAAPTVTANTGSVITNEGTPATNTGTYNDANAGDNVSIAASVGTVTKTGTNSGTWSWSNAAPDGLVPAVPYMVTITANDGVAPAVTTQFTVTVNNVAPSLTVNVGSSNTAYYVDWTAANVADGTASGVITLPDASTVNVNLSTSGGGFWGAQTSGGTNYWAANGGAPYISAQVPNPPPTSDIIQLQGGTSTVYTVTFSQPIANPIMAIHSLGGGSAITYDFNAPFTILSQGPGHHGGCNTCLAIQPGDVLWGHEGNGTIKFIGTYSSFSWTVPNPETWHGFTFAIQGTTALGSITVNEGDTATNTGTWSDPGVNDNVVLSASVGNVVKNANGTWSWSFLTSDGPVQTQTVTITATDKDLATTSKTFPLTVNNVAPTATLNAPPSATTGQNFTVLLTSPFDPSSVDTSAGFQYAFDCGSGFGPLGAGSSTNCSSTTLGALTIKGKIQDKDGGVTTYSATVQIVNTPPTVSANSPSVNTNEGTPAANSGNYNDSDAGQNVSISASIGAVTKTGTNNGSWSWSNPAPNGPASYTVTITANDGFAPPVTTSFTVTVNDAPPVLTVGGTVTFTEDGAAVIVAPNLTVSDPGNDNLTGATVSIGNNFASGQDSLGIQGALPVGISSSYNGVSGVLTLSGSASPAAYQQTLRQVTFSNNSQNPSSAPRTVTFSISTQLAFPDNGHFYEFVPAYGIAWSTAKNNAATYSLYGLQGYLATITSASENAFILSKVQGNGWLGASDSDTEGTWKWVTGPEAGTVFCIGLGNCVPQGGAYTNWDGGEPNNCCGNEDNMHMLGNPAFGSRVGKWNDLFDGAGEPYTPLGYVVEYGGMPGDPNTLQLTGNVTVNVVPVNDPPSVTLSGPTSVNEGGVLTFNYTVSDPENDPLTFQVLSCGNFGATFNGPPPATVGNPAGSFQCFYSDGLLNNVVADIQVKDPSGALSSHALVNVTVANVAPTATLNAPATAVETELIQLSLTGAQDVAADLPSLTYAFDCGDGAGYGAFTPNNQMTCPTPNAGTQTVKGKVKDKDNGQNEYTANVTVTFPTAPAFSQDPTYPAGACICTPLMMNTVVNNAENWWVKASGSSLEIELRAVSVNTNFGLTVEARIYDTSNTQIGTVLSAAFPASTASGSEPPSAIAVRTIATTPGAVYRVKVTTPGANPTQPHYKFKFDGASQAAIKSPGFASFEHQEPVRWFFNVNGAESLGVRWFSSGVPLPNPGTFSNTAQVELVDPSGNVLASPTLNGTISGGTGGIDQTVTQAGPNGQWAYVVRSNTANTVPPGGVHYRLESVGLSDAAIYLTPATWGYGTVSGTVNHSGGAGLGGRPVNLRSLPGNVIVASTVSNASGNYQFNNVFVGQYRVEVVATAPMTVVGDSFFDIFVACDETSDIDFVVNRPPQSIAGNYSVPEGGSVPLNGQDGDPDGNPVTYVWDLDNDGVFETSGQTPAFSAALLDGPSSHPIKLKVCDSFNACTVSQGVVNVQNVNPSTTINGPFTLNENDSVTLNGSITDPGMADTQTVTINWGDGTPATVLNLAAGVLTYSATHQYLDDNPSGTAGDTYPINVTVKDDDGGTGNASTSATVNNVAPVVNAGPDQTADENTTVTLNGSATDVGTQDTHAFAWVQTGGPAVTLSGANTPTPTFGLNVPAELVSLTVTFQLTVTDDDTGSSADTVTVTVNDVRPAVQGARTIGYWKNHESHVAAMLAQDGPINLGDTTVSSVAQAVAVLSNASASDARDALRAQLLAAILNLRNGADVFVLGPDIRPTVTASVAFLASHSTAVRGNHPDRGTAIGLKDTLDRFNNSGE